MVIGFNLRDISLGAQEFLDLTSKVNKLINFSNFLNEVPAPEAGREDFDWLFKGQYEPIELQVPELDAKLIDLKKEWGMIQSWFGDQKIKLERVYRASVDGFTTQGYKGKCDPCDMLITIVESEHGKRFGGYRGFKLD